MQKSVLLILCLVYSVAALSQCSIQSTSVKLCIGNTAFFSPGTLSATDSLYVWNFGDGSTSNQASPTYQYAAPGTYQVTLRVYSFGGAFCDAPSLQVRVFARPVASLKTVSDNVQCFRDNLFTFIDSSRAGPSYAPIGQRTVVFDDGALLLDMAPFGTDTIAHTYTYTPGGTYKVVLEVKDTNGCISQHIDSVTVHPKMAQLGVAATQNIQCGFTDVVFTHTGPYNASNTQKMIWIMGNGDTVYAPPYNNLSYRYNNDTGLYRPVLIVTDKNGCTDTANANEVECYTPDSALLINSSAQCFSQNQFIFYNPSARWSNATWTFTNASGTIQSSPSGSSNEVTIHFNQCGPVQVRMQFDYGGCKIVKDTQVFVYGPRAVLQNAVSSPTNRVQCDPKDTVKFRLPDINCYFLDSGIHFVWNFQDRFAPPCTTDTRKQVNVGLNCNFSVDSDLVQHYYSQPYAECYTPSLWVIDSITHCEDSVDIDLRIGPPKAGWDSTVTPVRRGVYYDYDPLEVCSKRIFFYFDEMVPNCIPDKVWLLPDSSCFPHQWVNVSSGGAPARWMQDYANTCGKGNITYGIVAANGFGLDGKICYDTAWYPLRLKQDLDFTAGFRVLTPNTCKPFDVLFYLDDTVRRDVLKVSCNFGDNSPNYERVYASPDDTVIHGFTHRYATADYYQFTVFVTSKDSCVTAFHDTVFVGKQIALANVRPRICLTDTAVLVANPFYLMETESNYWADSTRALQGKEAIYWNFGDDSLWHRNGVEVRHKYTKPGLYQVSVAYKDSTPGGCFDTLVSLAMVVEVMALIPRVIIPNDTFFCAPTIVHYLDSSYAWLNDTAYTDTIITSRTWDFGNDKPVSTLRNPGVFYAQNGNYFTRLSLETEQGCRLDTFIRISILGPSPRFSIAGDTFGCAPFKVRLRNETGKQLANWIWYFNDPQNQVYSTQNDSDITFTYRQPGVYRIDLVGEDRIYNTTTGTYTNCSEKFPYVDSVSGFHPRQVTVLKTDTLIIVSRDTVCEEDLLMVQALDSRLISRVKWGWGDLSPDTVVPTEQPAQHVYDTSGVYLLMVEPVITQPWECVVGTSKQIRVQKPVAAFSFDPATFPNIAFKNESVNAVRYLWDFGQPFSANNTSTETDPVHQVTPEPREIIVCLMAFDEQDCMDSVCKPLPLRASVKIPNVFTPGNNDGSNDAFDIEIEGALSYELYIYNRWGTLVFQGLRDGVRNDGINWDGRDQATGMHCPEGVYYIVFKYTLVTDREEQVYHGTVTLIRD